MKNSEIEYLDSIYIEKLKNINKLELNFNRDKILEIKIKSALFKNDFRMRKTFFLKKFQEEFGAEKINDLYVL